jgi:hypothetical protein
MSRTVVIVERGRVDVRRRRNARGMTDGVPRGCPQWGFELTLVPLEGTAVPVTVAP